MLVASSKSRSKEISGKEVYKRFQDLKKEHGIKEAKKLLERKQALETVREEGEAPWIMKHPDRPDSEDLFRPLFKTLNPFFPKRPIETQALNSKRSPKLSSKPNRHFQ